MKQGRRQFITSVIRGGIFISLMALGGSLVKRGRKSGDCSNKYLCSNCAMTDGCTLPEAEDYRKKVLQSYKQMKKDGRDRK